MLEYLKKEQQKVYNNKYEKFTFDGWKQASKVKTPSLITIIQ